MSSLAQVVAKRALREGDKGESVKLLQKALRATGAELVVDGDFGTITQTAVKRFQASVVPAIAVDGFVGPITARYLESLPAAPVTDKAPLPSVLAVAPWLARARAQTGIREIPGARSNPVILQWIAELGAKYPPMRRNINWYVNDDTPWCGLFEANTIGLYEPGIMPPVAPLWVANWQATGWGIELDRPVLGAIGIKPRKGGNHISTYESEWKGKVYCRGGNQANMVNVGEYNMKDFNVWLWPPGYPLIGQPVIRKFTEATRVGNEA